MFQVFDECNGGDLNMLLKQKGPLPESQCLMILKQIVSGLSEFEKLQVMHRDLKLANMFLHFPDFKIERKDSAKLKFLKQVDLEKVKFVVKIADLGFAREVLFEENYYLRQYCGSPLLMPPQVLNKRNYNFKADLWSLGVVYFQLLYGSYPFPAQDKEQLKRRLSLGTYVIPKAIDISIDGLQFICKCLTYQQEKRISYEELLSLPYLTKKEGVKEKFRTSAEMQHMVRLKLKGRDSRLDSKKQKNRGSDISISMVSDDKNIYMNTREPSFFNNLLEQAKNEVIRQIEEEKENFSINA